jgi:hypothetical protein
VGLTQNKTSRNYRSKRQSSRKRTENEKLIGWLSVDDCEFIGPLNSANTILQCVGIGNDCTSIR